MVYDWQDKEETCYRMYIEEKKSLEDIMEHFKTSDDFSPSKRAFQTQFRRWEFPSKQNPAHKNAELVQRVKQLWETNTSQREMLRILNEDDGFEIKERELMRVRAKNRWLLRVPNGMKLPTSKARIAEQNVVEQLQQAMFESEDNEGVAALDGGQGDANGDSPELSAEVVKKRQERIAKLQAESAERWVSRKRRRRTRGWAGLPADPPGPPRFPSETTIDESKAFLSLDNQMYRDVRAKFQRICEEENVIKKTLVGPERWEAVKARLVQESPHLQDVMWNNEENQDMKKLALDVVCTDVTKRMRTLERRMTIAEAKNALGVNPEESRQIRNSFYSILKDDHFTSKVEAGDEHWKELKAQWVESSDLLRSILEAGEADPQHGEKVKAIEVLCRDVMKRLRDDQTKRDPTRRKKFDSIVSATAVSTQLPAQSQSPHSTHSQHELSRSNIGQPQQDVAAFHGDYTSPSQNSTYGELQQDQSKFDRYQISPHDALVQAAAHAQAQARTQAQARNQHHMSSATDDTQIDPSLLLAAANEPTSMDPSHYSEAQYGSTATYSSQSGINAQFRSSHTSIAVYFRLHPSSDIQLSQRIWVATLTSLSMDELRSLAASKFPMTTVGLIEGVVKQDNNPEVTLRIEEDDELEAYLNAIGGVKPMFTVQIMHWKE